MITGGYVTPNRVVKIGQICTRPSVRQKLPPLHVLSTWLKFKIEATLRTQLHRKKKKHCLCLKLM